MKIYCYCTPDSHQFYQINNMIEGLRKHNLKPIIKHQFSSRDIPDLAITWAHKRDDLINCMTSNNNPYLVMERGYVGDRFKWTSCGFNGLNGRADFCNNHITDSSRWNTHFKQYMTDSYKDTSKGEYALVIGQVIGDAALKHVNIFDWYTERIKELNSLGIPVLFREHPLNKKDFVRFNLKYQTDTNEYLEDSLSKAKFVVTFSSNSGVVSVLNGVPVLTYDQGSMVYNITGHSINSIINPDRQDWANKIAWCQWSEDEIRSGEAWEHLRLKISSL